MEEQYPPRRLSRLSPQAGLRHPPQPPELVHLDSPALAVMTSFDRVWPVTVAPEMSIDAALDRMKRAGVRLLLVIGPEGEIAGLVSAEDLMGERPIRISEEQRIPRAQITVQQVMLPAGEVRVLDLRSVRDAQVGHILATLDALGRQHVLVVEHDAPTGAQTVVGLFSRTHIAKRMLREEWHSLRAAPSLAAMLRSND